MTTTVLIGTQGNKTVKLKTPGGTYDIRPGHWLTVSIHGEQRLELQETGDFVTPDPAYVFTPPPRDGD